ncbi:hypothetical protein GJV07_00670 [Enterobacteriaceae bacterium RIT711]|nr:hypothetical protein [Enterobacteriaceae bacterium RIT711]
MPNISEELRLLKFPEQSGGGGGSMETRVTRLEMQVENIFQHTLEIKQILTKIDDRFQRIDEKLSDGDRRLAVIESNYATKADLNQWKIDIANDIKEDKKWKWQYLIIPVMAAIIGGLVPAVITFLSSKP